MAQSVKNNGYACYVVGNRTVKGKILPTDQFTAWAFSKHGFSHEKTIQRAISGKRLPGLVSPENKKGITTPTMKKEFIIIMKKN